MLVPILEADPSLVIAFGSHAIIDAHAVVGGAATASNEARYRRGLVARRHESLERLVLVDQAIPLTMGSISAASASTGQLSTGHGCRGRLLARLPRRTQSGGAAFFEPQSLTRYRVHGASATAAGGIAWHQSIAACYRRLLRDPQLRPLWPEFRSRLGACERRTAISC
jgi:hypothetical protein